MSPFLKCRNAAAKAGSSLRRLLEDLTLLEPKIPPERIELATREKIPNPYHVDPVDTPVLGAISSQRPPASAFDAYRAQPQPSTAQQSSALASLDLRELRRANVTRQAEWCPDQLPDLSFRGNELAGETGEACNVIKKLERERHGWRGSRSTKEKLAEELADVVNCADLCALNAGIDLADAVVSKFNATSTANGLKTFIGGKLDDLEPVKSGNLNPTVLQNLVGTLADRERRRDAGEKTLARLGWVWRGGEEWAPPLGKRPSWLDEREEDTKRRLAASAILKGLGWRWLAGDWVEPQPVGTDVAWKEMAENLRDAIAYAMSEECVDALPWLSAWMDSEETAVEEFDHWRARQRALLP